MQQNLHVTNLTLLCGIYTQDIALSPSLSLSLSHTHTHTHTVSYKLCVLCEIQTLRARFYGIAVTSTNTALSFSFIRMIVRTNRRWHANITDDKRSVTLQENHDMLTFCPLLPSNCDFNLKFPSLSSSEAPSKRTVFLSDFSSSSSW